MIDLVFILGALWLFSGMGESSPGTKPELEAPKPEPETVLPLGDREIVYGRWYVMEGGQGANQIRWEYINGSKQNGLDVEFAGPAGYRIRATGPEYPARIRLELLAEDKPLLAKLLEVRRA